MEERKRTRVGDGMGGKQKRLEHGYVCRLDKLGVGKYSSWINPILHYHCTFCPYFLSFYILDHYTSAIELRSGPGPEDLDRWRVRVSV